MFPEPGKGCMLVQVVHTSRLQVFDCLCICRVWFVWPDKLGILSIEFE